MSSFTPTVVIPSKSKTTGGLTIMHPTKTRTARSRSTIRFLVYLHMLLYRNLFAIDYMREHPKTTTGEFALVYDTLDKAAKEVCAAFLDFGLL